MSDLKEISDRCRRIETRLTKFLEGQGFETKAQKPEWKTAGEIHIPSMSCSVKDILAVIPDSWDCEDEIIVYHKDEELMSVYKPRR